MERIQDKFPMIDKKATSKRLKYFMQCCNLKPADIQEYLGLTCIQTVYRWLQGVNIPSIDNLYALSQLFGVRVDDMLAGNRKPLDSYKLSRQSIRLIAYYTNYIQMKNTA